MPASALRSRRSRSSDPGATRPVGLRSACCARSAASDALWSHLPHPAASSSHAQRLRERAARRHPAAPSRRPPAARAPASPRHACALPQRDAAPVRARIAVRAPAPPSAPPLVCGWAPHDMRDAQAGPLAGAPRGIAPAPRSRCSSGAALLRALVRCCCNARARLAASRHESAPPPRHPPTVPSSCPSGYPAP